MHLYILQVIYLFQGLFLDYMLTFLQLQYLFSLVEILPLGPLGMDS